MCDTCVEAANGPSQLAVLAGHPEYALTVTRTWEATRYGNGASERVEHLNRRISRDG